MLTYHKIQSIFKREENGNFMWGDFSTPEIEFLCNNMWEWTEKVDGTNTRVMWNNVNTYELRFGGKTDDAQMPMRLLDKLIELFPKNKFYDRPAMTLYGEGYGAKVQKGGGNYIKDGVSFVLFDVKVGTWWLKRDAVEEIAKELGIQVVPIIGEGTIAEAIEYTRNGFKSQWGDFLAEGLVLHPKIQLFARDGSRIITKIKYKDFIKKGEKNVKI